MLASFASYGTVPTVTGIAAVAVPLMLLAALATHFNARAVTAGHSTQATSNPQAEMMRKLTLWVFPLGVLVGGPFLMIAILLYWVGNNLWTYGQQRFVSVLLNREDRAMEDPAAEAGAGQHSEESQGISKPAPGARPVSSKKRRRR